MENTELQESDCPACGSAGYKVWMDDGKPTRYVKCNSCGSIYANPRASWSERYNWLDTKFSYGPTAMKNGKSRLQACTEEAQIIQSHVKRGNILDIGCDLGDFFQFFPKADWCLYGIEVSPTAAAYASKAYNASVFPGLLHEAQHNSDYFDLVTLLDTIFYLDNPIQDFREIFRILKPGGVFAIENPGINYQMLRSRGLICYLTEGRYTRLSTNSSYVCWFTSVGLKKMLKECNFILKSVYPIKSPEVDRGFWYRRITNLYFNSAKWINGNLNNYCDWCPKYLILAQKP